MKSWRLTTLHVFFVVLGGLITLRLGYWQIVKADELKSRAVSQRTASKTIPADRGDILDATGFPLATNRVSYLMYADPRLTGDISGAQLQLLMSALGATESGKVLKTLSTKDRAWVPVWPDLSKDAKSTIENLKIAGLGFESRPQRFYPEGSISGQLLGFVGHNDNGSPQGFFGLEGYYDKQLSGIAGKNIEETDALNRPILIGNQNLVPTQEGRTLITSIDRTIQFIIYQKLAAALEKYGAAAGTVSVMDPVTGNVLAMVALPGYDPQSFSAYEPNLYKNPIVAASYEPGSTFKVLVMAAGIDTKAISPNTKCSICAGPLTISGYSIRTWNDKYYANSSMIDVLQHSDNVGMVFVQRAIGKTKFLTYLKNFGFGELTGVDLQDEAAPPMRGIDQWYELDLATASFGQGIAVTPIQMLRAVGAIANKGKLMVPRLVTEISDRKIPIIPGKQVVSPQAAVQVTEMMVNSVEKGEAKWAKPKGFMIAGKTGTAQIPVAGHYDKDKTIASFVGFAPAYDPKFVMLVTLNEPKTSQWGSETAAPLWFDISKELLRYLRIQPTHGS
jgi:cell division protein FtsI (penicillin-binding protein 3)